MATRLAGHPVDAATTRVADLDRDAARKFVAWSRARRSARFLWKAWHNRITDAVRQVHCDRRVTIDGRQYRVHPEFEIPISALALDGKATTKHWSD